LTGGAEGFLSGDVGTDTQDTRPERIEKDTPAAGRANP
jgi:hypothetical protein